jgi:hypothetical protein
MNAQQLLDYLLHLKTTNNLADLDLVGSNCDAITNVVLDEDIKVLFFKLGYRYCYK